MLVTKSEQLRSALLFPTEALFSLTDSQPECNTWMAEDFLNNFLYMCASFVLTFKHFSKTKKIDNLSLYSVTQGRLLLLVKPVSMLLWFYDLHFWIYYLSDHHILLYL